MPSKLNPTEVVPTSAHYDIRLHGMTSPDGEITLTALSSLAEPLQELMRSLGREVVGAAEKGRPGEYLTQLTELRLTSLEKGSTRLVLERGSADVLAIPTGEWAELDERFWKIVESVPRAEVPAWVSDTVSDRAHRLVKALRALATEVTFTSPGHETVSWVSAQVSADPWKVTNEVSNSTVDVSGRLEAVDLNSQSFRIRDDLGNTISLRNVLNANDVAPLVGHRVIATGRAEYSADKLIAVHGARLEAFSVPAAWMSARPQEPFDLATLPPTPTAPAIEVTDEEFADIREFLAAL